MKKKIVIPLALAFCSTAALAQITPTDPALNPSVRFEELDTNKDGLLNEAEWAIFGKTMTQLSEADKDKNGSVSRTEYEAASKMNNQGAGNMNSGANSKPSASLASFDDLDTNKDGALSPAELTVHGKSTLLLTDADKDKNGSVSRTEFTAASRLTRQDSSSMDTTRDDAIKKSGQPAGDNNRSGSTGGTRSGILGGSSNSYDGNTDN